MLISGCWPKQWDLALALAEFAFNEMINRSIAKNPFDVVYTKVPSFTTNLNAPPMFKSNAALKTADEIHQMLQEVRQHLEASNSKCKTLADRKKRAKSFSVGDLLMGHLSKGRTPSGTYSKLQDKKLGSFKICHTTGENAYVVLPEHLYISHFADIYPYFPPIAGSLF